MSNFILNRLKNKDSFKLSLKNNIKNRIEKFTKLNSNQDNIKDVTSNKKSLLMDQKNVETQNKSDINVNSND